MNSALCIPHSALPIGDRRKEKPALFHLELDGYGVMLHTNPCGDMFCLVQPANASRFACLHELQFAQRKHRVPAGARIVAD